MAHILLLILKILGFLILGILALILLLCIVFLLAPVVYRCRVSGEDRVESIRGLVRFHWLFHLISGEVRYEDGAFRWRLRLAWKKLGSTDEESSKSSASKTAGAEAEQAALPEKEGAHREENAHQEETAHREGTAHQEETAHQQEPPHQEETPHQRETAHYEETAHRQETAYQQGTAEPGDDARKGKGTAGKNVRKRAKRIWARISAIPEKLRRFWEKIKYTFHSMCDKIKALRRKKEKVRAFLDNPAHREAFSLLLSETGKLLKRLRPRKAEADLEFGFSDPSHTGYALALVSFLYPAVGEFTQIRPDFEHRIFRGSLLLRGRIRMLYGVIFALNLLRDRNVRTTYRHIRKFKL